MGYAPGVCWGSLRPRGFGGVPSSTTRISRKWRQWCRTTSRPARWKVNVANDAWMFGVGNLTIPLAEWCIDYLKGTLPTECRVMSRLQGWFVHINTQYVWHTLPETNSWHLKMDGWWLEYFFVSFWGVKRPIFRCKLAVSFREFSLVWWCLGPRKARVEWRREVKESTKADGGRDGGFRVDWIKDGNHDHWYLLSQWLTSWTLGDSIFSRENKVQTLFFRVHWLSEGNNRWIP